MSACDAHGSSPSLSLCDPLFVALRYHFASPRTVPFFVSITIMRSSVYVYVLLALTSSLTLAAPISTSERRFVIPPDVVGPISFPPPLPPIIKNPFEGMGPGPVIPPPGTVKRAEEGREFPFDQFDFSPLDNFLKDHPDLVVSRGVGSTQPASERRFVLPPGTVNPFPPFPPPLPPIIKNPLEGMGPGPVIPPPGTVKRAEEMRKRADGALLPVPGQAGHSFFPLPPDDSPVALPTPILDRDAQADFSDFLNKFFEAHPNQVFDRGVDYRRLYVDALHDLLQGAGESS
ncbi:hypothetical protein BC826DRAFT_1102688 [Russula brevipes]|nr:hypothetical protein BC826DRAFT_1102688 [Russula brevipes]